MKVNRYITIGGVQGEVNGEYSSEPGDREHPEIREWEGTITFDIQGLETINGEDITEVLEGLVK